VTSAAVLAACTAGLAVALAGDGRDAARRRLRGVGRSHQGGRRRTPETAGAATLLSCGLALAAVLWTLGGVPAVLGAAPAALVMSARPLRARAVARRTAARCAAQLPRAADLVAACLEAGATPADALDVVREHLGGPLAVALGSAAGALRAGADPLQAYAGAAAPEGNTGGGDDRAENRGHGPAWRGRTRETDDPARLLVRALGRALDSGAPVATTVAAVADEQRRRRRWAAEAAARRAGVLAVAPLALCFLPAFVLLGVVPVVLSIAADVLGGLT
jgi:pilus assembly protein TadC